MNIVMRNHEKVLYFYGARTRVRFLEGKTHSGEHSHSAIYHL